MPDQAKTLSFGEKAVGLSFNPSNNEDVDTLKKQAAAFIDTCHDLREKSNSNEQKRLLSLAITNAQDAQMWGVKGVTWED